MNPNLSAVPMKRFLAFALMLGLSVLLAAGCGARRSVQYSQEGDTYFRLGKLDDAATAYTRAEEADPNNAQAKLGLGRVYLARNEYDKAMEKYREAAKLDPAVGPQLEEAIQYLLRSDHTDDAFALADEFAKVNPSQGGELKAYLLRESGRIAEAVKSLQDLARQFPDDASVHIALAKAYLADDQTGQAEAEIQKSLTLPRVDETTARMTLVDIYAAQRRESELVSQLQQKLSQQPANLSVQLALARTLAETGKADEAKNLIDETMKKHPDSAWGKYVVGIVALAQDKPVDALSSLEEAAKALPQESSVTRRLVVAQAAVRGTSTGQPQASTASPATPAAPMATPEQPDDWQTLWNKAEMRRLLDQRDTFLAKDEPGLHEALFLAAIFTQNAALAASLEKELPENSPLQGYLALLQGHDYSQIAPFFDKWKDDSPSAQVMRANALAFALAAVGARAQAVHILSQAVDAQPQNNVALYNMAQVFRAARMPRYAGRTLERLISRALDNDEAHTLLFVVYREAGMSDDARKAAESAYSLFPKNPQMIMNLAQAYLDTGDKDLAVKVLQRGVDGQPDDTRLKISLAGVLLHTGQVDKAVETLKGLTPPDELKQDVLALNTYAHALKGEWDDVAAAVEQEDPATRNASMRLLGFAALVNAGQPDKAVALLRAPNDDKQPGERLEGILLGALGKVDPVSLGDDQGLAAELSGQSNVLAQMALAAGLEYGRFYEEAAPRFQSLVQKLGDAPYLIDSVYYCLANAPAMDNRTDVARQIAKENPDSANAQIGLASVLKAEGDTAGEEAALTAAVQLDPQSAAALQAEGQFYERQERDADALRAYEALIKLTPNSAAANNNLAYYMLTMGRDANVALQYAQKASAGLPGNPNVMHTLGLAQMRTGDLQDAQKNLAVALQLLPADPTLLLDYGTLLMRMGKEDDGLSNVELAVKYADQLGLEFPRRAEAEKLLAGTKKPGKAG